MTEMIICAASPGQTIDSFAAELVARAWKEQCVVLGEFNEHTLQASPGSTREEVMREWNEAQKRSYFK